MGSQSCLTNRMIKVGLVPENCREATIVIPCDGFIEIHYKINADEDKLKQLIGEDDRGGQISAT